MRRLRHGLIVAIIVACALVGNAWDAAADDAHKVAPVDGQIETALAAPSDAAAAEASAVPPAEATSQEAGATGHGPAPLVARVVKRFGATVRVAPSLESPVLLSSRCGDLWPVTSVGDGWVAVTTSAGKGWIGGGRVVVSSSPAAIDCEAARFLPEGSAAKVQQAAGCQSLYYHPSSEAPSVACVESGHAYTVLDGPLDTGAGQEWFRVSSPTTGTGWTIADALHPA